MQPQNTIRGASGRSWVFETTQAAPGTSRSTPFYGYEVGSEQHRVWVQRAIGGDDEGWEIDREHLRRAYRVGQLDAVSACSYIAAPIDLIDNAWDVFLVSDCAETALDRVLRDGPLTASQADALEVALRGALDVLHGLGLVHSDVREDNVLRFDKGWKLADLGGVVDEGEPIHALQKDAAYRRPGAAAFRDNDLFALAVLLDHARTPPIP